MKIKDLPLEQCRITFSEADQFFEVNYIQSDSRKIQEGDIFSLSDSFGLRSVEFIEDAFNRKAGAILLNRKSEFKKFADRFDVVLKCEGNPDDVIGYLASHLKGHPSKGLKIVAVTGTNGKTSVTHILYDLFLKENKKCGIIGTISVRYGDVEINSGYTTPDAASFQSILAEMRDSGIEYVFVEASSHGLKLGRLNGTNFLAGVFTNLTVDHLDFHPDMEDYRNSKMILFDLLQKSTHKNTFFLVYKDFTGSDLIFQKISKKNYSFPVYTLGDRGDFSIHNEKLSSSETEYVIKDNKTFIEKKIITLLLGNFNAINTALAVIVAGKIGLPFENIIQSVKFLKNVPGRFQKIYNSKKNKLAVVDYAHTPDALENVLKSARELNSPKLIVLFGCGGDRDKTKRPLMAKFAEKYSDFVIVSSDNPRTEDPEKIIEDIISGFSKEFQNFEKIQDRKKAIQRGIELLPEGGVFLVCGKGHEDYQIFGKEKFHFSDCEEIEKAFLEIENLPKI